MTEEPGQLIAGRYLLGRCLARGGMGSVWEAEHVELETRVAVKLLRPELGEDAAHVERFRREARTAAKLKSSHVVTIYDCGVDRKTPFIAMEFLEGEDLELRLGRLGRLEPSEALEWLDQAARGLSVAHAAGLVHRDVKPANLFIERLAGGERLKVVDFGIARPLASESTLTTGGGVWGSPAYMSPEQARGRAVDPRTDVWALAGVFYRMLTGKLPFPGVTEHDTVVEVCTGTVRPPTDIDPSLPTALDALFVRAFAKDPMDRTASVELLAQDAADALGQVLRPFDAAASRPSVPPTSETTRRTPSGPGPGRVTETKPLGGDTGPAPVTAPSPSSEASSSRRFAIGLMAAAAILLGGVLVWSLRPRVSAQPTDDAHAASHAPAEPAPSSALATDQRPSPPEQTTVPSSASASAGTGRAIPRGPAPDRTATSQPKESKKKVPHAPPRESAPVRPATDPLFGLPVAGDDEP